MSRLRFGGWLIVSLAGLALSSATADAGPVKGMSPGGVYDPVNTCINEGASLTPVPSLAGDQFVVRSPAAWAGVARTVAKVIRDHQVFKVYEQGLKIPSLIQPGQPGKFPVFVDTSVPRDGLTSVLCPPHETWVAVVINPTILSHDELSATVVHELFHAATDFLLGTHETDNWWFEATATDAESWFGFTDSANYDGSLVNHPSKPMDTYGQNHQYGAYLFAQWILDSPVASRLTPPENTVVHTDGHGRYARPTAAGWAFLRNSLQQIKALGDSTRGVDAAIAAWHVNESLSREVASFWADHTNSLPAFGPPATMARITVSRPKDTADIAPAEPLGARIWALYPAASIQQMTLQVDKLPAGVEMWVNVGKGNFWVLQPGDSLDEVFCRSGHTPGSYPLPDSGDIRIALTTTDPQAPPPVTITTLTSTASCPPQLVIVPGFGIGQLHLAMTAAQAQKAAGDPVTTVTLPVEGGIVRRGYVEAPHDTVYANFFKGRIVSLGIQANQQFITTTGIDTYDPLDALAGSTEADFISSAARENAAATCSDWGKGTGLCTYQKPATRYTLALILHWTCPDFAKEHNCYGLGLTGHHVAGIAVSTKKGYEIALKTGIIF